MSLGVLCTTQIPTPLAQFGTEAVWAVSIRGARTASRFTQPTLAILGRGTTRPPNKQEGTAVTAANFKENCKMK